MVNQDPETDEKKKGLKFTVLLVVNGQESCQVYGIKQHKFREFKIKKKKTNPKVKINNLVVI